MGLFRESSPTHYLRGPVRTVDRIRDEAAFLNGLSDVLPRGGFFEIERYDENHAAAYSKRAAEPERVYGAGWFGKAWRTIRLPLDDETAQWLGEQARADDEPTEVDLGWHIHATVPRSTG